MSRRQEKSAAIKLFEQGYSVKYVYSQMPHVSERSIYNWHQEYIKNGGVDRRRNADIEAVVKVSDETLNPNQWAEFAEKTASEISENNAKIRRRLETLLWGEIGKDADINYRAVNCLVSCICAVQKQEWIFGSFSYLDVNRAVKLLHSMGYKVSELSEDEHN